MKDDSVFLNHVLEAISWINKYTANETYESFESNHLLQDGIVREIEIIGEASKNLSNNFIEKNNSIPWKDIIGMRNKLIHNYFGVDYKAVWKTVKDDLPVLENSIKKITAE